MPEFHVAIDGPAGSGKSTISSLIAQKLGWIHIDTGAMYRAVTLEAINLGVNLNEEESYHFLETTKIRYEKDSIYLNDRDVTKEIRSDIVTQNVSLVSSFPYVRNKMVELQKNAAIGKMVVMDGRDIGTVVLPHAQIKVFLTANVEERAKRRYAEHMKKGKISPMQTLINDIKLRDYKDSNRAESPLKKASDAIMLDTTYLTIEEVVDEIIKLIRSKGDR